MFAQLRQLFRRSRVLDDLFGAGSALEFAVEDKEELKDLIEASKLVLERIAQSIRRCVPLIRSLEQAKVPTSGKAARTWTSSIFRITGR